MVKETNIVLRIDKEKKTFFQKMADRRGMSLTTLIMGLISDGERLERERRERVQNLAVK